MNDPLFTDEPAPAAGLFTDEPAPPQRDTDQAADYWRQKGDYPAAGEEKPPEQKFAEAVQTVGAGMGLPYAAKSAYDIGKGVARFAARSAGKAIEATPLAENIPASIERIADNQMLKSTGASMGQIKQIGPEAARRAAQVGRDSGLGDVFTTDIGREAALKNLDKTTGQAIGSFREEAGQAPAGMLDDIVKELRTKYAAGVHSGEQGALEKAIETAKSIVEKDPSHAGYARAATTLNNFATANKVYQPVTAATDVANKISAANNAGIAQTLGADKAKAYLDALSDEQAYKVLEHFFKRGELREMAGRGSVKGFLGQLMQSVADSGGYRATSKLANALHEAMTTPMSIALPTKSALKSASAIPLDVQEWVLSQQGQ